MSFGGSEVAKLVAELEALGMLKRVDAAVCPARAAVVSGAGVVALLVVIANVGMWLRDEGRNPSGKPVVECNVYSSS